MGYSGCHQGKHGEEPPPSPAAVSGPPLPSMGASRHFCGSNWYHGPWFSRPSLPQALNPWKARAMCGLTPHGLKKPQHTHTAPSMW